MNRMTELNETVAKEAGHRSSYEPGNENYNACQADTLPMTPAQDKVVMTESTGEGKARCGNNCFGEMRMPTSAKEPFNSCLLQSMDSSFL